MGSQIGMFGSKEGKKKEEKEEKETGVEWLQKLTEELIKSPVATNISFGFILMGLERLVEMQFECPCKTVVRNTLSSLAFFIIPALMSFLLMLVMKIQECTCGDMASMFASTISSVVPSIIWMVLLFLDGRYFTCAMTDWPGRFVDLENSSPQKWCEPFANATCVYKRKPGTRQQCMLKSQEFFVTSQWIGVGLLAFICLGTIEYIIGKHYRKHYRDNIIPAKEVGKEEMQTEDTKQDGGDLSIMSSSGEPSIITSVITEAGKEEMQMEDTKQDGGRARGCKFCPLSLCLTNRGGAPNSLEKVKEDAEKRRNVEPAAAEGGLKQ